ncbi:hypothetical protein EUTSA_v10002976mg [Eutrema salsugineum]|uniref:F-box associated beta-propeller type 3 domain-containing protein n=1 Tax=Eutrema salsugineum TaxID=72664 RepID=V4MY21_EUTSA|nr:hypothetical protein EUTSA_v10002976mg [Eutrema salsugineum]
MAFYSSPRPQNPDEKSTLVLAPDSSTVTPGDTMFSEFCGPVAGLIYFPNMRISKENMIKVSVIYNPTTGQYRSLPKPMTKKKSFLILRMRKNSLKSFLGYDPIDKQFKAKNQILTLGTGKLSWRKFKGRFHKPNSEGISINGVVYYFARTFYNRLIACFDGKLGLIKSEWVGFHDGWHTINFHLWVLEDVKKQEWSKHVISVEKILETSDASCSLAVVGVTATGDIVFSIHYTSEPTYVFYFNPERNILKRFEIRGFEEFGSRSRVYTFADHVADHRFIT